MVSVEFVWNRVPPQSSLAAGVGDGWPSQYDRAMPRWIRIAQLIGVLGVALSVPACSTSAVSSGTPLASPVAHDDSVPAHVQFLRELERSVARDTTSYRHARADVQLHRDGTSVCHADCSSLLNEVFTQSLGIEEASVGAWLGRGRPRARDYFDTIVAARGFQRITSIGEVRVGDIIAIRYEAGASNTGHVMVVNATPRLSEATRPMTPNAKAWEVDVIDCSASGHGPGDSRVAPDGSFHPGIGRGTVRLFCDASGAFIGHTFTMSAVSPIRSAEQRPIAVGRVTRLSG